jgi:isopentenyl-diphosphate Delta-isomerase
MEYDTEEVDIVDEQNKVIGKTTRGEAHRKGHIHRALSVVIINSRNKILLQQRSANRSIHPLSWDLSASEHVLSGESFKDGAKRSAREELGVEVEVTEVTKPNLQKRQYEVGDKTVYENEMVEMLKAVHEGPFKIDPNEVNKVGFFSIDEIEKMIAEGVKFTPWFLFEWGNVKNIFKS